MINNQNIISWCKEAENYSGIITTGSTYSNLLLLLKITVVSYNSEQTQTKS
jgi:hypothetical protein